MSDAPRPGGGGRPELTAMATTDAVPATAGAPAPLAAAAPS
jgi:hypothetical protein